MISTLLAQAIELRRSLFDPAHQSAFRLFNGFSEGNPDLALDIYASTLVIHNYADDPTQNQSSVQEAIDNLRNALSWLHAGVIKTRNGKTQDEKRGQLIFGQKPDTRIKEHDVWYAVDLTMNRDA